jgi:hypothetical protein
MRWLNSTSMDHIKEYHSTGALELTIPAWLKVFVFAALSADLIVLVRAFGSSASELFGISVQTILSIALPVFFLLILVTTWFVFFPSSRYAMTSYWLLRFLREQVIAVALLSMLYLLVSRVPLLSLRGGFIWLALVGLFVVGLILKPTRLQDMPAYQALQRWGSLQTFSSAVRRIPIWVLQVIVAFLPVLLVLLVIYFVFDSRLANYGPYSLFNDEVSYWIWLRSYHDVGLASGYNVPNELLPMFEFSRYGEQSPLYLYIYGLATRWIYWFPVLPVLVNFVLLPAAIFAALRLLKLTAAQTIFVGSALLVTWPVLLYLPITTHETLNQALGILLAVVMAKLLIDRETLSLRSRLAILLFVYFATLIRLSWGLLLIPALFYSLSGRPAWRAFLAVLLGGGLYVAAFVLTSYFTPPINDTIASSLQSSSRNGLSVFFENIYGQLFLLFRPHELTANIAVMFQMAVVAGWSLSRLIDSIRSRNVDLPAALHSFEAFHVYNMVSLVVAGLTFYVHKNFFRAFAPSLLIVYLIQIKRKEYKPLAALLTLSILLFPAYMNFGVKDGTGNYELIKADYPQVSPQHAAIQAEIEKFIVYDPDVSNPWCNTLLIPLSFYDSRLILVPSGIGISYIMDAGNLQTPLKSGYMLFDETAYQAYKDTTRLELLTSLPVGDLYRNRDADCPGNGPE